MNTTTTTPTVSEISITMSDNTEFYMLLDEQTGKPRTIVTDRLSFTVNDLQTLRGDLTDDTTTYSDVECPEDMLEMFNALSESVKVLTKYN